MTFRYISNARTLSELRSEFLSDLQRRLDDLDKAYKIRTISAAESARIGAARRELIDALEYWKDVELISLMQSGQ